MCLGRFNALWPQCVAAALVVLAMMQSGCAGAWSSPYLMILTTENSTLPLTPEEASWVASLLHIGRIIGAIIGGISVQFFGSQMGLLMSAVPGAVSWVFIGQATSATWLYIGRIFAGVSTGMTFSSFPLYFGEIGDPSIRGGLVSMGLLGGSMGTVIVSAIAIYVDIPTSSWLFLIMSLVFIVCFAFLPASPHHLARVSTPEKTKASIRWYDRGCDVETSYAGVKKFVDTSKSFTLTDTLGEFKRPEMRKAFFIVLMLFMYQHTSGITTFILYMEKIFTDARVTIIAPSTMVIIESGVAILGMFSTIYLIDRLGRKSLLILCSTGVIISLMVLATHFILLNNGFDADKLQAIPIVSFTLYMLSASGGFRTVPSTILSETLPSSLKGIAACAGNVVGSGFAFLCSKTFQILLDTIGEQGIYWIYTAIVVTVIPFVIFCMPETKGKSLQQIQDEMIKGRKRRQTPQAIN